MTSEGEAVILLVPQVASLVVKRDKTRDRRDASIRPFLRVP